MDEIDEMIRVAEIEQRLVKALWDQISINLLAIRLLECLCSKSWPARKPGINYMRSGWTAAWKARNQLQAEAPKVWLQACHEVLGRQLTFMEGKDIIWPRLEKMELRASRSERQAAEAYTLSRWPELYPLIAIAVAEDA